MHYDAEMIGFVGLNLAACSATSKQTFQRRVRSHRVQRGVKYKSIPEKSLFFGMQV